MNRDQFYKKIDSFNDELINLRRHIHAHPELSGLENQTAILISGFLKNIGKLFPGPSKTTRAYTLKEKGIINAAKERGFKVVKKKLNQAPIYFSKLIEFEKIK